MEACATFLNVLSKDLTHKLNRFYLGQEWINPPPDSSAGQLASCHFLTPSHRSECVRATDLEASIVSRPNLFISSSRR
ncbi:hypothetical protein CEXT_225841 [Caerostris extrusa]|uniref:Uncharacterized protein n=1 Tax=Caerostris extrusa TaxID=172846 RepID=A0AAV4UP61_CAEEX|nr:hypothetical protein CEXT_225841 [Caerostris extrusa]